MKDAKPWIMLSEEQVFALEIAGKTYYVQMTEEEETEKVLRIYQDENDLKSCIAMMDQDFSGRESIVEMTAQVLSQSTLICALSPRDQVAPDEQEAIRTYAKAHGISLRGRYARPQIQRLVYFQMFREPDPEEENALMESIDAIVWLSEHMKEKGIQIRKISSEAQWITLLRKTADGYTAEDMEMRGVF